MTWQTSFYFGLVLTVMPLTGFLAWQGWSQRSVPGSRFYAWLALAMGVVALEEMLSMLGPTPAAALFWFKVRYLPFAVIPPLWFLFVLEYSGRTAWVSPKLLGALFAIPLVTQLLVWSNPAGWWVQQEVGFRPDGVFWIAEVAARLPGPWFLVHIFSSIGLMLAGSALLLRTAWRNAQRYQWQAALLTLSALVPTSIIGITTFNLLPQMVFNPTIPGFALGATLAAAAVFRFDFLKQSPAAPPGLTPAESDEKKHSLGLYLLVFILLTAGFAAYAIISYQSYTEKFRAQVEKQLLSITSLKVSGLEAWRAEQLSDANLLRENPAFSDLVETVLDHPTDTRSTQNLLTWLEVLRANYHYSSVTLLDAQGTQWFSAPVSSVPPKAHLANDLAATLAGGQVSFLDFHRHADGKIYLGVLIPVYAGQALGRPLGVVIMEIDPADYLYPYLEQWPVPSETAETLLVRQDGGDALYLNPIRFQPEAALNQRIPLTDTDLLAAKAIRGPAGVVEGHDYRGQSVIGAVAPISNSPWFLVARMDAEEVFSPLRERLWQTVLFWGVLVSATGLGLTALWRQENLRFYRGQAHILEALRESEEKYRLLFENMLNGFALHEIVVNDQGQPVDYVFLETNSAFAQLTGLRRQEILGKKITEVLPEIARDPIDWIAVYSEVALTSEPIRFEQFSQVLGKWYSVLAYNPKKNHFATIFEDITERKQAEKALQEAEARFRAIFEQAAVGIAEVSTSGRWLNVNQRLCDIVGYTRAELLQKTFQQITFPEDLEIDLAYVRQMLAGEIQTYSMEKRYIHKNGALVWINLTVSLVRNSQAAPRFFIAVVEDISQRKQAEAELQRLMEELKHSNTELEQFAYISSHDLQEPLRMVSSYMQLLERRYKGKLDDNADEFIGYAVDGANRMQRLINDLLLYSRVGTRSKPFIRTACEQALALALSNLEFSISESGAEITHTSLPVVLGDKAQLAQLFQNLLGNAIKFRSAQPLRIQVSATLTPGPTASGSGEGAGEEWVFAVRDNGLGFEPQYAERIFVMFQRLHTRSEYPGTGMGLAICKKIVERHGGRIWVESQPQQGSTFYFTLPKQGNLP